MAASSIWLVIKSLYDEIDRDRCLSMAAGLAYYMFLALFPMLLFVVALTSLMPVDVLDQLLGALGGLMPGQLATTVTDQVARLAASPDVGVLTLGIAGAIWSGSTAVHAVIGSVNLAYDVQDRRPWWRVRLMSIGLTLVLTAVTVVAFALLMTGPAAAEWLAGHIGLGRAFAAVWSACRWPVNVALIASGFALIYFVAPDQKQRWWQVLPGAVLGTLMWLGASAGFKLYLTHFGSYNKTYGTITAAIVALLWLYLAGLAVLVGAELNAVLERANVTPPAAPPA